MKKSIRSLAMLSVCAVSLVSCTSKVDFAEFQKQATEAIKKECDFTKAKVTGSIKSKSESSENSQKIDSELKVSKKVLVGSNVTDIVYATLLNTFSLATFSAAEVSSYTYYAGGSFKVTYSSTSDDGKSESDIEWNEYGLVTVIKGSGTGDNAKSTYNLKVSYSK